MSFDLSSDRETNLYEAPSSPRPFQLDDGVEGECLVIDGQRHCNHDHGSAPVELQDVYEQVPGWTAQQKAGE